MNAIPVGSRLLPIALMLCSPAWPAAAAGLPDSPQFQRVRSDNAVILSLIDEGDRRSATFRQIVLAIEATDGVVYIEPGKCRDRVRGCLLHVMSATAANRYVWIAIDLNDKPLNLMVLIAHELRHALEILSDASIRTGEGILSFYHPEGSPRVGWYETAAALAASVAVRDELGKKPSAKPES